MLSSYFSAQRLAAVLLCIAGLIQTGISQAQFLSTPQVLRESAFDYKTLVPATSTSAFLTQANA